MSGRRKKPARRSRSNRTEGSFVAWLRAGGLGATIVKIGGVATAIAAVIGVVFTLDPGLRPASHSCNTDQPPSISAVNIDQGTFADFLTRAGIAPDGRSSQLLRENGLIVSYTLVAPAYQGKTFTLDWTLLRDGAIDHPEALGIKIKPDTCRFASGEPVWVRNLRKPGQFKIELQLIGPDGDRFPAVYSRPFSFT
jgi:hypothetical protein